MVVDVLYYICNVMMKVKNMIDYISANNGKIEMFNGDSLVGIAKSAEAIAYVIKMYGVSVHGAMSSSMDFADEYGFDNYDDAKNLWNSALELI